MPTPIKNKISFLAFFIVWAERMGWAVPDLHVRVCYWLEHKGPLALLMLPRGHAKSTILGIYNAWRYYCDPTLRILHQGESDATAFKTARDTKSILERHPLTMHSIGREIKGEISFWWLRGNDDMRNPSMQAAGIMTNITSSRADEVQNDDVEVPKNIQTQDSREKMRNRLGEQVHISVPGATELYVGTPHTHDSIYAEIRANGADCFIVRMFDKEYRIEDAKQGRHEIPFMPEFVFAGIGGPAKLLQINVDYQVQVKGDAITLVLNEPAGLLDCYAGQAWPERFGREELTRRRKRTRTINEWDSQYQLHAKPITQTRLDPDRLFEYALEPVLREANDNLALWLGQVRIVTAALRWDPASGDLKSDVSALGLVFIDGEGRRYIHRTIPLLGDIAEFADDGKTITGGQCWQICDVIEKFSLARVRLESNGIGKFAPAVLKSALKQRGLHCGVTAEHSTVNKSKRILEALEPLLQSPGMLWAHSSVIDGPLYNQMRQWNPALANQEDDYLDVVAAACSDIPERVGREFVNHGKPRKDWGQAGGSFDIKIVR
jgi:hypothetical protein